MKIKSQITMLVIQLVTLIRQKCYGLYHHCYDINKLVPKNQTHNPDICYTQIISRIDINNFGRIYVCAIYTGCYALQYPFSSTKIFEIFLKKLYKDLSKKLNHNCRYGF